MTERHPLPEGAHPSRRSIRLAAHSYAEPAAYFVTLCTADRQCIFGRVTPGGCMWPGPVGRIVVDEWLASAVVRQSIDLDRFVVMPNHFHAIVWVAWAGGAPLCGAAGDLPVAPAGAVRGCSGDLPVAPAGAVRSCSSDLPVAPAGAVRGWSGDLPVAPTGVIRGCSGDLPVAPTGVIRGCSGDLPVAPTGARARGPAARSLGALLGNFKAAVTRQARRATGMPGLRIWQRNYFERVLRDYDELLAHRQYIIDNPAHWEEDAEHPTRWAEL